MQLPAAVSHQIVHYRSPEEQFHSFSTIGEEELYKLAKSAKPTTCMLDLIPSKLLKEVLPEVIDSLLAIINLWLSLGYVPKTFKLAVIKTLIKKTQLDPADLVNYRPILNLPFLSNILEKVVSSQLYSFLEKKYICEDFQSGFRPSHITETALIRVTNDLLLSSDRGCISLLVLLDLSTAFETIDRKILLNRLENFVGISGSALAWFKSYLSDRHQFLAVNEEVSYRSQVQYVVPQGSVLGPLLFTLYMLPLGNIIRKHRFSFHCSRPEGVRGFSRRPGGQGKCCAPFTECCKGHNVLFHCEPCSTTPQEPWLRYIGHSSTETIENMSGLPSLFWLCDSAGWSNSVRYRHVCCLTGILCLPIAISLSEASLGMDALFWDPCLDPCQRLLLLPLWTKWIPCKLFLSRKKIWPVSDVPGASPVHPLQYK